MNSSDTRPAGFESALFPAQVDYAGKREPG